MFPSPHVHDVLTNFNEAFNEPTMTRTTAGIAFSCLFTFFACAWCCIRPNIPSPYDSKLRILSAKLNVLFWVLVCPELIAFWTFRQWFVAKRISDEFQGVQIFLFHGGFVISKSPLDRGWTRRHALFLMMGGFLLAKDGLPLQTISVQLFRHLLQRGAIDFPALTVADIQERSNLHPILLSLILLQAIWFVLQCISRLVTGLVITQLEVMTFTLVVMSVIIFAFAWQKPLDVRYPVLITPNYNLDYHLGIETPPHFETIVDDFRREKKLRRIIKRISLIDDRLQPQAYTVASFVHRHLPPLIMWPLLSIYDDFGDLAINIQSPEIKMANLKVPLFYLPESSFVVYLFALLVTCLAGMGNGIVHCLFWSRGHFSSEVARIIWRVTSVTAAGFCAASLFITIITSMFPLFYRLPAPSHFVIDIILRFFNRASIVFLCLSLLPFVLARITLVFVSFFCLRSLPQEALEIIPWTGYIPHLA